MFNKPLESHLSKSVYGIINGSGYYLKIDEAEILMPDGFYILEPEEEKGKFYIRRNGIFQTVTIRKFDTEEEKENLYFLLNDNPDIDPDKVNAITEDELKTDYLTKFKEMKGLMYSVEPTDMRGEKAFRLLVFNAMDYLMLDDGCDILGDYIYWNKADLNHDIEAMGELFEFFTEI